MSPPLITAVICTRNRERYLGLCLDSLLRQTLPRDAYEIVVVDNGSTDGTREVCARYAKDGVRHEFEPVIGLSRARNTGWRAARSDFVGYLDDDGEADPTWLAAALEAFQTRKPVPDCVGGPIRLLWETPEPPWMNAPLRIPLGHLDWGSAPRRIGDGEWLMGGNSFYPRSRLEQLGGFDERLGRKKGSLLSGEETQLYIRIRQAGGYLFYAPGVSMQHHVTPDRARPLWFYRRYFWGGVSDAVLRATVREDAPAAAGTVAGAADSSRLTRLLGNSLAAAGFAPLGRRIQSRIYMAYVFGWIAARLRLVNTSLPPAA